MRKPKREADGTFAKGVSGNPQGRPPKKPAWHRLPSSNRRATFEVAEMPVQVTIDGEVQEVSAYRAVLLALAKKAMNGHGPSMKQFLAEVRTAAVVNGEQAEFTQFLIEEHAKMQATIDKMTKALPLPAEQGGVYVAMPDGSLMPGAWHDRLTKLERLEKEDKKIRLQSRQLLEVHDKLILKEKELEEREKAIKEAAIQDKEG